MSCFVRQQTALPLASIDCGKHVNYVQGMILGVDDLTQEFAYLSARDHRQAREALGYGTLRGLAVVWQVDKNGVVQPGVEVSPGAALTPGGQMVCVPRRQCADLNLWLKNHDAELSAMSTAGAVERSLTLHVVLSFRDCLGDDLPIPGEPCRAAAELMQPSRVSDSFLLDFAIEPPAGQPSSAPLQGEEDALRGFFAWLRAIPIDSAPGSAAGAAKFDAALRQWVSGAPQPPGIAIPAAEVVAYQRRALRLWVTELRPLQEPAAARLRYLAWVAAVPIASGTTVASSNEELLAAADQWTPLTASWRTGLAVDATKRADLIAKATVLWTTDLGPRWFGNECGCSAGDTAQGRDDRVLLGSLTFRIRKALGQPWQALIPDPSVLGLPAIDQTLRPILLHLRALQEGWVTAAPPAATSATPPAATPQRLAVVAAGRLPLVESPVLPPLVFGGLKVVKVVDGAVTLAFASYLPPGAGKPDFVVKILAGATGANSEPAFRFKGFESDGFVIAITRSAKAVLVAELATIVLHVEVTALFP